ncbi:helix-turn-helix domain-containing protein [Thauera sp. WH-2]|uniref:helix-turn-helix domain-containing protein n=1 Tax=Thauera sp. WH-2 TaxID=3401574 RepID=UPI003AADFA45
MSDENSNFDEERIRFGARIRFLRLKINLSQEDLAASSGLDRTYIGGIERGERNPSLKNIVRLAISLGVSPRELFSGSGDD